MSHLKCYTTPFVETLWVVVFENKKTCFSVQCMLQRNNITFK